ncbi:synaptonemal complex protein 3-like [Callospermophilus lateralis]|uniref:synaptonemal complex protein 3-like n=1 Tax=Callospermophilus lateralis TaxID=76772 RepID=UPI0040547346
MREAGSLGATPLKLRLPPPRKGAVLSWAGEPGALWRQALAAPSHAPDPKRTGHRMNDSEPCTSCGKDRPVDSTAVSLTHLLCTGGVFAMTMNVNVYPADITQALLARRKRFEMNTDASLKIINENIEHIRKIQQEQRQNLHYKYSQQFLPLFQQWDIEVQKAEEQEEKLANMFQEQRKLFLQSRIIQREKVKEIKNLYEQLLKSIKDLEEYHESLVIGEQSKVKKEMAELQEKILRETQQQEVAVVEKSLHSLLY